MKAIVELKSAITGIPAEKNAGPAKRKLLAVGYFLPNTILQAQIFYSIDIAEAKHPSHYQFWVMLQLPRSAMLYEYALPDKNPKRPIEDQCK